MAWTSNGTSAEFAAGHTPLANMGRSNDNSLTLNDTGLDQTSEHWAATTPHGVLQTALGGSQDDSAFERLQRDSSGGYQPGSMAQFQDQLSAGTNDNAP